MISKDLRAKALAECASNLAFNAYQAALVDCRLAEIRKDREAIRKLLKGKNDG